MKQKPLDLKPSRPRARRTDPHTSHAAARSIDPASLDGRIVAAHGAAGEHGLTSRECATAIGADLVSVSPRLRPLERVNLLRETDRTRPGPSGRACIVWVAA